MAGRDDVFFAEMRQIQAATLIPDRADEPMSFP
jgi:hypothetical protein